MTKRRPSALIDTKVIYCGDNFEHLGRMPDACVDLIYIDPPFNSNRNYEVFWGETKEKRSFEDRHESTRAYIEFMRPRCVELARVLKKSGSFYYHCDWHASHYVKVMLDQIFGENNFLNEIIWKRSDAHNDATLQFPVVNDSLFLYGGGGKPTFHPQHVAYPTKTSPRVVPETARWNDAENDEGRDRYADDSTWSQAIQYGRSVGPRWRRGWLRSIKLRENRTAGTSTRVINHGREGLASQSKNDGRERPERSTAVSEQEERPDHVQEVSRRAKRPGAWERVDGHRPVAC